MPKLSGLQFFKSLNNPPLVIFTTAYPEYAVEGFEVNAIDYLLKPFPFERFLKAVNKATEVIASKNSSNSKDDYILLKADKKIHRVIVAEITNLESLGDYIRVYYGDKSIVVNDTLNNLLNQLPDKQFIRVHKSHVISVDKFDEIEGNIIKIGERKIPIGQTYKADFFSIIKNNK
jgi:DNA-binding LytR/AlgR family response regulator